MKTLMQKLKRTLQSEFPRINPDLIKASIRLFSGGLYDESFDEFYQRQTHDLNLHTKEEKDDYVFKVVLDSARALCKKPATLDKLKSLVEEAVTEVKQGRSSKKRTLPKSSPHPSEESLSNQAMFKKGKLNTNSYEPLTQNKHVIKGR